MDLKDRLFVEILPRVKKPARYAGGEYNMVVKDWDKTGLHMALCFPDVYEVGMSHLGSRILYGLVNEHKDLLAERCYAPWPDMEQLMRENGVPLYSLETFHPVSQFDVVAFSLMYELTYTNVLNMLNLAGIPVLADERGEEYPLVIAGGTCTVNPEPMAAFIDAFIIGEGEEVVLEVLEYVRSHRGLGKKALLKGLAGIAGVYVPSLYHVAYLPDGRVERIAPVEVGVPPRVTRRVLADLDQAYYPTRQLVPYLDIVHDRGVLEVMRGCQRTCRFCQAGMVYRPVRERSVETLLRQAGDIVGSTGYDEVSLASLSTADYTGAKELVTCLTREFGDKGVGVSLPSLRVDAFSVDLAREVQKVRKTTLTFAPEAGTQRLRDVINKNVTEEDLMSAVSAAFSAGWLGVKLYFMVGLPTETEEDWMGIVDLTRKVKQLGDRIAPRKVKVSASIANFVPKPHTPFQWRPQISRQRMEEARSFIRGQGKKKGVNLDFHDADTSFLEGVMARGDRRLGQAILKAHQLGAKFDGWREMFSLERWLEAFTATGIDPVFYTERERSYDEVLPWDVIDVGVTKDYLILEDQKAEKGEPTPDCREGCENCGVCMDFGLGLDLKGEWKHASSLDV